jgi:hypothetical protein
MDIKIKIIDNFDEHEGYVEGTILNVLSISDDEYMVTDGGWYVSNCECEFVSGENEFYEIIFNNKNQIK